MKRDDVCAVCVLYQPDGEVIRSLHESLKSQVKDFVFVDNTPCGYVLPADISGRLIYCGDNRGIAYAQNIGIQAARFFGYDYILLSDQDTIYPHNFISNIFNGFSYSQTVDVVVPEVFDSKRQTFQGFVGLGQISFARSRFGKVQPIRHANASGMLIRCECFDVVGYMREDFFIDWVDFEWCWRLASAKRLVVCQPSVIIDHALGDSVTRVCGATFAVRNDQRYFYIIRNGIYLVVSFSHLSLAERIVLFGKLLTYIAGFTLISRRRFKTLKVICKAILFGLVGRMGKHEIS
ncbi:hypothetical protein [Litorivicinus lipolyticus]|uniref:hypothetical protein n=1 Tax=Litorivicinus lipolyticus TaxID=418701 RepID=UPI003B5AAF39